MKNTIKSIAALLALTVLLTTISCKDDEGPEEASIIRLLGLPTTASIDNLGTYAVTINLTANKGLASLSITKNGTVFGETIAFDGEKSEDYEFTFTATADDSDGYSVFVFTATDTSNLDGTATLVLSIGDAPE